MATLLGILKYQITAQKIAFLITWLIFNAELVGVHHFPMYVKNSMTKNLSVEPKEARPTRGHSLATISLL
jgi:hypothetical protein